MLVATDPVAAPSANPIIGLSTAAASTLDWPRLHEQPIEEDDGPAAELTPDMRPEPDRSEPSEMESQPQSEPNTRPPTPTAVGCSASDFRREGTSVDRNRSQTPTRPSKRGRRSGDPRKGPS